jgi:NSS family neurotransmitter:Na+ symporter
LGTGLIVWLLGVAICLSFNRWRDYRLFGLKLFEFLDFITSCLMMPLSGLAIAVFVGWAMRYASVADEMRLAEPGFTAWYRVVRYFSPLAIALVFLHVLGVFG